MLGEKRTCLWYHFETQPIPSPLSFFFHFLPKAMLSRGVDVDLIVQLYTSWLVLVPLRRVRRAAGYLQIAFMVNIAASGNFSVLNHLTILPSLACLDDGAWPRFLRQSTDEEAAESRTTHDGRLLLLVIAYLSRPVVANLLSRNQVMNTSFDPFKVVNTYGAFGSVGEGRYEPVVALSEDGKTWREVDLPCKPTDVKRRPCFCAPYHHRLDWNIWFIDRRGNQPVSLNAKPSNRRCHGDDAIGARHLIFTQALADARGHAKRWLYAFLAQLLRGGDAPARRLLDPASRDVRGRIARVPAMYPVPHGRAPRPNPGNGARRARLVDARVRGGLVPPVALRADGNLAYFEAPRRRRAIGPWSMIYGP